MGGWALLVAAVGVNYANHRRHRPTICSITRRVLPRPAFLVAGTVGAVVLGGAHLERLPRSPDTTPGGTMTKRLRLAVALLTAVLAVGVTAAPAEAKSGWPCPGCRPMP